LKFLGDVDTTGVTNGQALIYNSTLENWQPGSAGGDVEGTEVLSTGEAGGTKFLREDGDGTCSWVTISGGGDALVANPLSQFAATTSAQLAGVISDETGSGLLVFGTSPTLITPALGTPSALVATNATGTASGLTAGNVTTNANLTGHVTSVGNAAVLGTFSVAQLNTAISDATLSGNNTGDEAAASTTVAGVIELATDAEMTTGTATDRAITPANAKVELDKKSLLAGSSSIVTVGTISSGTWQGTAINQTYLVGQSGTNTGDEPTATDSAEGVVELATDAEMTTGTATNRAVTPANAKVELDKKLALAGGTMTGNLH
jgi:hypothetical protein